MSGTLFFVVKVTVSALVIALVSELAKRLPSLGGLIAAMPLTTLLAMIWIYLETGDTRLITVFTRSVLLALVPTTIFFLAAVYLLHRGVSFVLTLLLSLALFTLGALVHQALLAGRGG